MKRLVSVFLVLACLAPAHANNGAVAEKGRGVFDVLCYHCHGSDAVQGERIRDLRRLQKRHGDEREQVFLKTVTEGRTDRGMPAWKDSLTSEQVTQIWAFLETVQAHD